MYKVLVIYISIYISASNGVLCCRECFGSLSGENNFFWWQPL